MNKRKIGTSRRVALRALQTSRLHKVSPDLYDRLDKFIVRAPMADRASLHEFWRQPAPEGNDPQDYITFMGRSQALAKLLADIPKHARVLEVGCNVGRNLAYLYNEGWTKVEGVEINENAVALLRKTYPELSDTPIHIGPAEEVLPEFEDRTFDAVYTMAVLEHIHPDSASVFDDIARIAESVLAIEPASGYSTHRQFPHDIPEIFQTRGFALRGSTPMTAFPDAGLPRFTAFRFDR